MNKLLKFINNKVSKYPSLRFSHTNNEIIKKFYMNFNLFFIKKNKSFKEFFIDEPKSISDIKIYYNLNHNPEINETHLQSLKQNGILILENVLTDFEHNEIIEKFYRFKNDLNNDNYKNYHNKNLKIIKSRNFSSSYSLNTELNPENNLRKINDWISKKVYGKVTKPIQRYEYKRIDALPEENIFGENIWHADRYMPSLKFLYFPFSVTEEEAPHKFAIGTHKINKEYLNFFIKKTGSHKKRRSIESPEDEERFLKNKREFPVKKNTLIASLTNGFHARSVFKKKGERFTLVLQNDDFKVQSLISYSNSL